MRFSMKQLVWPIIVANFEEKNEAMPPLPALGPLGLLPYPTKATNDHERAAGQRLLNFDELKSPVVTEFGFL